MSESPRESIQAAQLQLMQQFGQSQPEMRQPRVQQAQLPDPPQLQIHSQGLNSSFTPAQYASQQSQLNGRSALLQPHAPSQQFSQQQYVPQQQQHPQQHFRQPPPAHQQSQHQLPDAVQPRTSPARSRGSGKGSPNKAQAVDSAAVHIRANSQYPSAQQVHFSFATPGLKLFTSRMFSTQQCTSCLHLFLLGLLQAMRRCYAVTFLFQHGKVFMRYGILGDAEHGKSTIRYGLLHQSRGSSA